MPEDEEKKDKKDKLGLVELADLENLVNLAARSMLGFIQHLEFKNNHLYYLQYGGIPGFGTTIYFIKRDEIKEKYIVYNKTEDKVSLSDKLDTRGNLVFFPIIHVKKQNILSEEELTKFLG